ncbi:MAG: hypothetical protein FIA99_19120 [Ruminiclostridium sp.]|nr:hypothetical protein [Ruminiclostridium sp.]
MLFTVALEDFLEHLKAIDRSPHTIEDYRGNLTRFVNYLSKKNNCAIYVDEVTPDDFEKYLYEPPNDKRFSQVTRQGISTAFKSFYTFCYKKGYCDTNIGQKVAWIKAKPKERIFIYEHEMLRLVDVIKSETDKALLKTLFYAGLRVGEAIKLKLDDVNYKDHYLLIRKQKSRYDRKVPISIKLEGILANYLENYRDNEAATDNFFTYDFSLECIDSHLSYVLKQAVKESGLNVPVNTHIMRHSFASNLINKGVNIVIIQKLLGHQSVRTTQIYLHANLEALKKAIDTL